MLYFPLIAFSILLVSGGVVKDTLYPIRFYLTCALALGGGLALFSLNSKGQSISEAFRSWLRRGGASRRDRLGLGCIVMYLVWVLVSSAASPMSGYAWLGSPYTLFGSIMLVACFGVMLVYAHSRPLRLLPPVMALVTLVMTGLALAEAVGFKPLGSLITSANISYPAATIGHRPHLGGWFALVSLMPVFFFRNTRKDAWFWLWLLSGLLGLGLTTTSAATLGVGVGLVLWIVVSFLTRKDRAVSLVAGVFCVACIWGLPPLAQTVARALGQSAPVFKEYGSTTSFKPRLYLWKAAWNAALERPLLGWGDETFAYQVFGHLSPEDGDNLIRAEYDLSPDYTVTRSGSTFYAFKKDDPTESKTGSLLYIRPHDVVLDELYSHGFVGLFLQFGVFAYLLSLVKRSRSLLPFAVAFSPYAVYLLAWFYVATVTPLYFALLGCALSACLVLRPTPAPAVHS